MTQEAATAPTAPTHPGPTDPANIDWNKLGFAYQQTRCYVRRTWRDGAWQTTSELLTGEYLPIHILNTGLHYGQSCFEGLKAFRCTDGQVRTFRPQLNAERLAESASRLGMPPLPVELFLADVERAIRENIDYVPPRASGGSLYIRPLLFGSGCEMAVAPAPEFTFLVIVVPVGSYYKSGVKAVPAYVVDGFDRAAPLGVGSVKAAGNYAPCLPSMQQARARGYPITLFLDAKTRSFVEEFATANFLGLKRNTEDSDRCPYTLVTPDSSTILPSVTRRTLCEVAEKRLGWRVEHRAVPYAELQRGAFSETAACGTAVVLTPVNRIVRDVPAVANGDSTAATVEEVTVIGEANGDELGPGFRQLYETTLAVQSGQGDDTEGWMWPAQGIQSA